jgi:multidrug efflux pump subunit AcrB
MTIAISTVISAFNSLTLSPALAALLLKGHDEPKDWLTRGMDRVFGGFFRQFNKVFKRGSENYGKGVPLIPHAELPSLFRVPDYSAYRSPGAAIPGEYAAKGTANTE